MQDRLRVGLNLLFLGEKAGGAGRYALELPRALLEAEPGIELHLFVSADAPSGLEAKPWAQEVRWVRLPVHHSGPPLHVPAEYLALPALAAARRLDVLHSPANTGPTSTPGLASVVSLLDLIWLHRPREWEASPRVHRTMKRRVMRAVRKASRIFAISHAAAEDISSTLGVDRGRIEVTPLGTRLSSVTPVPEADLRRELDLGERRLLLCVAQKRPYKNLHLLLAALPSLPQDVVLVLCGSPTDYERELRQRAQALGVADRVRMPDWLSEAQLEGLYACSSVFVLPSLIEGFGLPVIEAMLRGLPVACSRIPALTEIAGDAALTFDPGSEQQAVEAILRLLQDRELAQRLAQRGRQQAASYAWRRTGEMSVMGYRNAIAARAGAHRRPGG